jgi:hypothetical protein
MVNKNLRIYGPDLIFMRAIKQGIQVKSVQGCATVQDEAGCLCITGMDRYLLIKDMYDKAPKCFDKAMTAIERGKEVSFSCGREGEYILNSVINLRPTRTLKDDFLGR